MKLEKLAGTAFTYDLHEMDNTFYKEGAIGYCDSKYVPVLQKKNMVCVMYFTEDKGNFWMHLSYITFNKLFPDCEKFTEELQSLDEMTIELHKTMMEHHIRTEYSDIVSKAHCAHSKNLNEVSAEVNGGFMYFVANDKDIGWWAYNLDNYDKDPSNVKVVNEVGGYHYRNLTVSDLKFAKAISRKVLPSLEREQYGNN